MTDTSVDIIHKYFPGLTVRQKKQYVLLGEIYPEWNARINVISRKDIEELYLRHVLHSLGIAKVISFKPGSQVLDVGTGGGFPGIPLAIMFPETHFHLVDSIGKKIKVVKEVADAIGLQNVEAEHLRAEKVHETYDFVVSRAVTRLKPFMQWVRGKFKAGHAHELANGVLYLKGGDLEEELKEYGRETTSYSLSNFFEEDFFETKKVIYVPMK